MGTVSRKKGWRFILTGGALVSNFFNYPPPFLLEIEELYDEGS